MDKESAVNPAKTRERSVAYPSVAIGQAIELSHELMQGLGKGPYSRLEAAKGIGHATLTGTAARKVAALVQYGLLERIGNTYAQTPLAQDILIPTSDEQKRIAIIKAMQTPRLFAVLIQRYQGQALPAMLGSILVREKINHNVAEDVAHIFRESLQFAGLLQNGVVLKQSIEFAQEQEVSEEEDGSAVARVAHERPVKATGPILGKSAHVFQFPGGVSLCVPTSPAADEAILDGELKEIRSGLKAFAEKYCQSEESQASK